MSTDSLICSAIQGRHLIQIYYIDPAPGYRVIEPYTLGYNRADHLMLNGWFLGGESASQEGPGYRDYLLEKISSLDILNEHFQEPKPGYVPMGGKKFRSVVCDLSMN